MSERDHMVIGLVKDLLGPRDGPFEVLPLRLDPRTEYITGVLAPEQPQLDIDIEDEVEEIDVVDEASDDELPGATEGAIIAPLSAFSPALDPKAQPRSIGISFVIIPADTETVPVIDICATWARYDNHPGEWVRSPRYALLKDIALNNDGFRQTIGEDIVLYMRVRFVNGHYRISLHILNTRTLSPDNLHADTTDFVFQPQLRVHCVSGKLASVEETGVEALNDPFAQEDVELALLYRKRPVLARGHLCGVLWKEIDPERPHEQLSSPDVAPFAWTDRVLLSPEDQKRFSPADVRTEFLPCYPVEAPEVGWPLDELKPELDLQSLAEIWQPEEIRLALNPLVDGYTLWIDAQEKTIPELLQHWQEPARRNLNRCREAAARMYEGIDWLIRDEDVRLAFCFANRAIALQAQWARKGQSPFPWRPFQLAFILLNIAGMADPLHSDRDICDLLWFPTGGGKTEAYLGLAAFTLGLRRLRATRSGQADRGAGVSVLSRYTLRLLTIQQFRRALGVITACELLRVANLTRKVDKPVGWRPAACEDQTSFVWGHVRFSTGMWVGGNVTPNNLASFEFPTPSGQQVIAGALDILRGASSYGYNGPVPELQKRYRKDGRRISASGDPAQVLSCPVCRAILAIPEDGLAPGSHTLHFVFSGRVRNARVTLPDFNKDSLSLDDVSPIVDHSNPDVHTLSVTFTVANGANFKAHEVDRWWYEVIRERIQAVPGSVELLAARPARPGYFLETYQTQQRTIQCNNFEIYCPDPHCELNRHDWVEQVPLNATEKAARLIKGQAVRQGNAWSWHEVLPFVRRDSSSYYAERIPIPAYTIDDQVYHRCPSLVIATVDKFARLAFEPKAASLFGNVTHYHARWGFYREGCAPDSDKGDHPRVPNLRVSVSPFAPLDLVIQDELHLLEGPLGSMVGLYETAINELSGRLIDGKPVHPKYVSSSATVRQAESQVQALFERRLASFPPSAIDVDDRFFARTSESHPLDCAEAGRLYVGVSAPGKGAQTPIVRIWSALLRKAGERRNAGAGDTIDPFWTLVGYFNALRELAGALALYRQDIPQRLQEQANARELDPQPMELSSRANSLNLPSMLEKLGNIWSGDAVLATSMFGTGVDVNRLGLMVVHGQPKTTSAYIQATGRVGRSGGGLVVSFFRVSRPRDLDHYEFFTGYHRMLYRAVEPVTVTPFAPRARERCLGPLSVALLRQGQQIGGIPISYPWQYEHRVTGGFYSEAIGMDQHRYDSEVVCLPDLFERRAQKQPDGRRPPEYIVRDEAASELDRWHHIAARVAYEGGNSNDKLVYNESSLTRTPQRSVVLGDAQHQLRQLPVAYENAPNSLRDVEETTQFKE